MFPGNKPKCLADTKTLLGERNGAKNLTGYLNPALWPPSASLPSSRIYGRPGLVKAMLNDVNCRLVDFSCNIAYWKTSKVLATM